jgi:uncharacterized protein YodC (DUF2158 family)
LRHATVAVLLSTSTTNNFGPPLFKRTQLPKNSGGSRESQKESVDATNTSLLAGNSLLFRFILNPQKESKMAFEIGNVVQLRGGGPIMTVTHLGKNQDGSQNVTCTWFDKNDSEMKAAYHEAALQLYKGKSDRSDHGPAE